MSKNDVYDIAVYGHCDYSTYRCNHPHYTSSAEIQHCSKLLFHQIECNVLSAKLVSPTYLFHARADKLCLL
jgi:hypothetical protein